METASSKKRKPNWLLRGFVGVSFAIHMFVFMHISNLYRSSLLTHIELTVKEVYRPPKRSIPRPRIRSKTAERPKDVARLNVNPRPIPVSRTIKAEPPEVHLPDSLVERIGMSETDIPSIPGMEISAWHPEHPMVTQDQAIARSSYLEMVRLRIENQKKYPKLAKVRQIEGRVMIQFIISPSGDVKSVEIIKGSRFEVLDKAALKAVKGASPFPRPPSAAFSGAITLKIDLVFELT